MLRRFISGCAGVRLTDEERQFFAHARPCGLIVFDRNCRSKDQLRSLIDDFKDAVGDDRLLVLVDQEGGRVQRMKPPEWRALPAGPRYGALYLENAADGLEAARLIGHLVASELAEMGINVNCVPMLDLPVEGTHAIIADRAYGVTPDVVASLGMAVAEGHLAGGVCPVIKHLPGHGRAKADSHLALPRVDASLDELERTDFEPFRRLNKLPAGMTGHVVFSAIDGDTPVSTSPRAIESVIRQSIGFDGLLMSDDLSMGALVGLLGERARAVILAGSDIALHCNGKIDEMRRVAENSPVLDGRAEERFNAAWRATQSPKPVDQAAAEAALNRLMGAVS